MIVSNIEAVARTTKKIAAEVIEAVDAKTGQAVPEVQAPQVAPLPEQDTKTVTYKGKVVDKDTLDNPIFEVVEHMPEFPDGGMSALMEYFEQEHQISGSSHEERYARTGYRAICSGEGWQYYQCKNTARH